MYHFLSSQVYSSMFIINVCVYIYIHIVSLCILLFLYVSLCFFASINDTHTHTHEDINRLTHVPQATQINFANELGPVDIQPF